MSAGRPARSALTVRLAELGLVLPDVSAPKGVYAPAVRSGLHVMVSGQVPLENGALVATGRVGDGVTPAEAYGLSRRCALAALAAADSVVGRAAVVGVVKVVGYVASADGFTQLPGVVDGASELFRILDFGVYDAGVSFGCDDVDRHIEGGTIRKEALVAPTRGVFEGDPFDRMDEFGEQLPKDSGRQLGV